MSRQLAISSALSVMAMAAMVLFGTGPAHEGAFSPTATVSVEAPHLPGLAKVLTGD